MNHSKFLAQSFDDLIDMGKQHHTTYLNNAPFPNIYFDQFFVPDQLKKVLDEFPELGDKDDIKYSNPNELKLASRGEYKFKSQSTEFVHFLNSQPFLEFLTALTGIENLIPDPYFIGGGFHQIKPGGFLKLHADFAKHRMTDLDRRINVLVYLNENWEESFGGHFELWETDMSKMVVKVAPLFNRLAIFSTTDFSYHGHPDPLTCPPNRSRKSIALYYYTNGRPANETSSVKRITTNFKEREGQDSSAMKRYNSLVSLAVDWIPPVLLRIWKKRKNT